MIPPRLNVTVYALHHDPAEPVHTPHPVSLQRISIMPPSSRHIYLFCSVFFDKKIKWILTLVTICFNCSYNKAHWNDCLLLTRIVVSWSSQHAFTHKRSTLITFFWSRKLFICVSRLLWIGPINISNKRLCTLSQGGKAKYSFAENSSQRTQRK
jgi:hypothetical protein